MIVHDRQIAENTTSNRQRLYGNTFQQSGDRLRSSAILLLSDSSDQVSVSDHMETRLKSLDSTRSLTIIGSLKILPAIVSD